MRALVLGPNLSGCSGKVVYQSRKKAVTAGRGVQHVIGTRLFPYRCLHCTGYHLSHLNLDRSVERRPA